MARMNPDRFVTFLREAGAEILEATNQYEIVRFRTINGVSVLYEGRRGYSFSGEAKEAWEKFGNKSIWFIRPRKENQYIETKQKLLERDGSRCFFCGIGVDPMDITVEHLLPIADGGNNNMKNLCLSCQACNTAVGNMAIVDKIRYREGAKSHA